MSQSRNVNKCNVKYVVSRNSMCYDNDVCNDDVYNDVSNDDEPHEQCDYNVSCIINRYEVLKDHKCGDTPSMINSGVVNLTATPDLPNPMYIITEVRGSVMIREERTWGKSVVLKGAKR